MTHNRNTFLSLLIVAGLFGGCNSLSKMTKLAKEQELKVDPSPLELHGDEVAFNMSAKLPTKMLKKNTEYELQTYFANEGAEPGNETFKGEPTPNNLVFVSNKYLEKPDENPKLAKDFVLKYDEKYERGELYVKGIARKVGKDKTKETVPMPVAKGIITTSTLVRGILDKPYGVVGDSSGTFALEDHGYAEEPAKQVYVDFNFAAGSSALQSVEARDKGALINAFVADKNIPEVDGKSTINIKGSHSPEGSEMVNTSLSEQRAQVMKNYYLKQMRKYNYGKNIDSIRFEITTQTLDDTKAELFSIIDGNASLSADQIADIKAIMNGEGDFQTRANELASKDYYSILMDEVYPSLRYARTDVFQGPKRLSDEEITTKAKSDPQELTEPQLLYAATLTPDLDEKIKIYEEAIKKDDSPAAHNNLAAIKLEKAIKAGDSERETLISSALNHLEMARNKKETAEVDYNTAIAYAMQGDKEKGEEYINKAIQIGSSYPSTSRKLNAAKGVMLMKEAKTWNSPKYAEAVDAFSYAGDFNKVLYNKGLANLLSRNFEAATADFDAALEKDSKDAHSFYAKAIVGARQGNAADVVANLKRAIQLDSNFRTRATKDLEFANYFNSAEFKDAIR